MTLEVCCSRREQALRTLVRKRTYDSELVNVVCRACGRADKTVEHIVTECTQLHPLSADTDLAVALGFGNTEGTVDYHAVRHSKLRLEHWRKITLERRRFLDSCPLEATASGTCQDPVILAKWITMSLHQSQYIRQYRVRLVSRYKLQKHHHNQRVSRVMSPINLFKCGY
ncbi:hypothetical protein MTO96_037545 [Rhipicephalus appendiculatus]